MSSSNLTAANEKLKKYFYTNIHFKNPALATRVRSTATKCPTGLSEVTDCEPSFLNYVTTFTILPMLQKADFLHRFDTLKGCWCKIIQNMHFSFTTTSHG